MEPAKTTTIETNKILDKRIGASGGKSG
jgi:hypothetical protein